MAQNRGGPTAEQQLAIQQFEACRKTFEDVLDSHGHSREIAIAKTKLQEAVMWASQHVTR